MGVEQALTYLPETMHKGLRDAYEEGGDWAFEMLERGEMRPDRALMAGLALDPQGRRLLELTLTRTAGTDADLPGVAGEVIVGGGAHAAVYAAVRVMKGYPPPLVLEKNQRFGGTFAVTQQPSFYLNSRNRPGPGGAPGTRDALNVIPGALIQPADLGGSEYQANADLGLVIRSTLVMNATVRHATVECVSRNRDQLVVETNRGMVMAQRVIVATGLGERDFFQSAPHDGKRVMSFEQLMRRFDENAFPLRGLGRVAVVGGGDSGRTAIEALTGYGPYMAASVASLDYVPRIDWYGIEPSMTKDRWLECNRTRYKPLAALFPNGGRNARVFAFKKAERLYQTLDATVIDGQYYDTVISCLPFERPWSESVECEDVANVFSYYANASDTEVGLTTGDQRFVVIGVAANPTFNQAETGRISDVKENRVALFRLVPRTSALASELFGI